MRSLVPFKCGMQAGELAAHVLTILFQVCFGPSQLHVLVSPRDCAISQRTAMTASYRSSFKIANLAEVLFVSRRRLNFLLTISVCSAWLRFNPRCSAVDL
jgi:hypothetical protein